MLPPFKPRLVPQCTACLRSYAAAGKTEPAALRQQIRGKKKMVNKSATTPVRLRKDVKTFGPKGAIVPVPRGLMRNEWFPRRVADYVTVPELRALRIEEAAILRDFEFDSLDEATKPPADVSEDLKDASEQDTAANEMRVARDMELVASSVPERIEMFREPILEEKGKESARQKEDAFRGTGAASDLLALRRRQVQELRDDKANQKKTTAIYGSVTIQDVLTVIRGAMGEDEDAKSVALHEGDLKFVDLPQSEDSDTDRLKHLGDFTVEIKVKGAEDGVRKIVGVLPHSKKADQDGQAL